MLAQVDQRTQDQEAVQMRVRGAHVIRAPAGELTLVLVVPLTLDRAVRVMIDQAVLLMRDLVALLMRDLVVLVMRDQADRAIHVLVVDGIVLPFVVDRAGFLFSGEGAAMCRRQSLRLVATAHHRLTRFGAL